MKMRDIPGQFGKKEWKTMIPPADQSEQDMLTPLQLTRARKTLRNALQRGLGITEKVWNYNTRAWPTSIHAADIDGDGDIEILIGSRDGQIRALTKHKDLKWKTLLSGDRSSIDAIVGITRYSNETQIQILAGSRAGILYGFDHMGVQQKSFQVDGGEIRHLYVDPRHPEHVIVGCDDHGIYVLDCETFQLLMPPFFTEGSISSVFSCDIDDDGKKEFIAASSDRHIYVLGYNGALRAKISTGDDKVRTICAAPVDTEGITLLAGTSNKKLLAWNLVSQQGQHLHFQKKRLPRLKEQCFAGRISAIAVLDINKDKFPELLVVTRNGFMYILDRFGTLLWKYNFEQLVTHIFALDVDLDGMMEVLVGTEDNNVQMLRIELNRENETRYQDILSSYRAFSQKESRLLAYLTNTQQPTPEYQHMEWNWVDLLIAQRRYEEALLLLLRLKRQGFQHLWSAPITCKGSIRAVDAGNHIKDEVNELTLATENGYVEIIDPIPTVGECIISKYHGKRIHRLTTSINTTGFDDILISSDDHHIYLLNHKAERCRTISLEGGISTLYVHKQHHKRSTNAISEVIIGQRSGNVHIYDHVVEQQRGCIKTEPGLYLLCTTDQQNSRIITVNAQHRINAYTRDGKHCWQFEGVRERVHGIYAGDIDRDGQVEVVVASENCSVYVLDENGCLKWRYLTPHRILALEVADINGDNNLEILLGIEDSHMYVLDHEGDLHWTYKASDHITAIHAQDLHEDARQPDGKVEIAVAAGNQLELLQALDSHEVIARINYCWKAHQEHLCFDDRRTFILKYIRHHDMSMDALALAKLAGSEMSAEYLEQDSQEIETALENTSLELRMELARIAINFTLRNEDHPKAIALARKIFQLLSSDPRREVRLTLVNKLHHLKNTSLCFEYLERLSNHEDAWVRRAVIRTLESLMPDHPQEVFKLLLKTAKAYRPGQNETLSNDEKDWILQETGRSLAHFFAIHQDRLFDCIRDLIAQGSSLYVIQQIAYSSKNADLKSLFSLLVQMMGIPEYTDEQVKYEQVKIMLDEVVQVLGKISHADVTHSEGILQLYEELQRLFHVKTIGDIEQYTWIGDADLIEAASLSSQANSIFQALCDVIDNVRRYRKRRIMGERLSALIQAYDTLTKLQARVDAAELERIKLVGEMETHAKHLSCPPEDHLLACILRQWLAIILAKIEQVRGTAVLRTELRNKSSWDEEQVAISLQINNQGDCPAENVQIDLQESPEFEIVEQGSVQLDEIGARQQVHVEFTIRPLTQSPRLFFQVAYTDAEGTKSLQTADKVQLMAHPDAFVPIPDKYRSGLPLTLDEQDREIFFGRKKDIHILQEKLTAERVNSLVVLSGQRRSGKTSLLYQLMSEINARTNHQAIFIDLQGLALKENVAQLLSEFAHSIVTALQERQIDVAVPDDLNFEADPTAAFDLFLSTIRAQLGTSKLILLIDEFETLQDKIEEQQISANVLKYLRNLIQHRQGISLLFAGAPKIRHLTEWYWAAFFNIAYIHTLAKLAIEEAEELITRPVSQYLRYDNLAVEKLHRLTNDQPYLIHLICATLIQYCNKQAKNYVTVNDVNIVCDQIIATQSNYFNWIWNQLQDSPVEQMVLAALAQNNGDDYSTPGSIRIYLEALGHQIAQQEIVDALKNLREEEFIEKEQTDTTGEGGHFTIPTGLTRAWLRFARPLE
jgi:outer membrane protein assembly factor BamB